MVRRLGGNIGYAVLAIQLTHCTALHRAHLCEHVALDQENTVQAIDNLASRLSGAAPQWHGASPRRYARA